ncbi:unnamed protein product [Amoebophrya sp. A25]|nr:unnamed protein product [Amoebophrya sp. A25]|eukprot:GSA25T00005485001.1
MDASAVTGESSEAPALSGGQQLPPQVDDNSPPNQLLSSQFLEQVGSIDLEDVESADFETVCQAIATRPPRAKQQSRTGVFGSSRERGQRKKPLSEKEYSAGLRLAKALDALGEDETGDISAMAKSLRPGRR